MKDPHGTRYKEDSRARYVDMRAQVEARGFNWPATVRQVLTKEVGRLYKRLTQRQHEQLRCFLNNTEEDLDLCKNNHFSRTKAKLPEQINREIKRLAKTRQYKNKPLSIAVRVGCEAAHVRRVLGLPVFEADGFDGLTFTPDDFTW